MYVLHSFSHSYARALGIEQATGVYLTAGIVSSLVSYIYKKGIGVPGYSLGAVRKFIFALMKNIFLKYKKFQSFFIG